MRFDFCFPSPKWYYCFLYGSLSHSFALFQWLLLEYIRFPMDWLLFTYYIHTWSFRRCSQSSGDGDDDGSSNGVNSTTNNECGTHWQIEHLSVLSIFSQRRFYSKWEKLSAIRNLFRRLQKKWEKSTQRHTNVIK